jgi:2-polyprenyl-3-methyl-5-hydroxy-6-metoxy-1,4-benzoquinol methylase
MSKPSLLGRLGQALWLGGPLSPSRKKKEQALAQRRLSERWDREWIHYFQLEDPTPYLLPHERLTLAANITRLAPREVHGTRLTLEVAKPLHIFMPGSHLASKRIFEVGCGPGLLCKQLGLIAIHVVGIDHSKLALHIARAVSPATCSYYHSSQVRKLRSLEGTFDCMVCRFFFIHQNYDNSLRLLRLARRLLRPGGLVGADFFQPDLTKEQGVYFPAKSALSQKHPSCGFVYSNGEVEELAAATGFRITTRWESRANQRLFVLLERQ